MTFLEYVDKFVERKKKHVERGTWKVFLTFRNHIAQYEKKHKVLSFEDIDLDFIDTFCSYMYSTHSSSKNYVAKMIEIARQVMGDALDRKQHDNHTFKSPRFRVAKTETFAIALTMDEVKQIADCDLSNFSSVYNRSRDYFILACWTGLRHSDWQVFPTLGTSSRTVTVATQKTSAIVTIPLNKQCLEILKKYDFKMPSPPVQQVVNRCLKEIVNIAGITGTELKPVNRAGKKIILRMNRYDLVSTHTARRTFATNAYLSGLDTLLIRAVTGHRDERTLLKYIKLDSAKKTLLMSQHEFFK
jgi:integrase